MLRVSRAPRLLRVTPRRALRYCRRDSDGARSNCGEGRAGSDRHLDSAPGPCPPDSSSTAESESVPTRVLTLHRENAGLPAGRQVKHRVREPRAGRMPGPGAGPGCRSGRWPPTNRSRGPSCSKATPARRGPVAPHRGLAPAPNPPPARAVRTGGLAAADPAGSLPVRQSSSESSPERRLDSRDPPPPHNYMRLQDPVQL